MPPLIGRLEGNEAHNIFTLTETQKIFSSLPTSFNTLWLGLGEPTLIVLTPQLTSRQAWYLFTFKVHMACLQDYWKWMKGKKIVKLTNWLAQYGDRNIDISSINHTYGYYFHKPRFCRINENQLCSPVQRKSAVQWPYNIYIYVLPSSHLQEANTIWIIVIHKVRSSTNFLIPVLKCS